MTVTICKRFVVLDRLAAFGSDAKIPARMIPNPEGMTAQKVGQLLEALKRDGLAVRVEATRAGASLWRALYYSDGRPVTHMGGADFAMLAGAEEAESRREACRRFQERQRAPSHRKLPEKRVDNTAARTRPCMCCHKKFRSEGIHNRLCSDCRKRGYQPFD